MQVEPVSGALGAEVLGVDLADELSTSCVADLRAAFNEHQVLFFRDQDLSATEQIAFGRRFGPLGTHPYVAANPDHPEVIDIVTEADDRVNFGGGWHSDVTFLAEPDLGSILYAVDVPPAGGDTLFASQAAAYEALSPTMRGLLDGLIGIHSASRQYGGGGYSTAELGDRDARRVPTRRPAASEHPVVRTHPETGRRALYVNEAFTIGIKGMSRAESKALLGFLFAHATEERFTCRFRWRPGPWRCGTTAACSTTPCTTTAVNAG